MRESAQNRGYTKLWAKTSKAYLAKNPLCVGCLAMNRAVAATLTDHVIPHKGSKDLFWDSGNWQSSCTWHHSVVKQELERIYEAGKCGTLSLQLNSSLAVILSNKLRKTAISTDGWPASDE